MASLVRVEAAPRRRVAREPAPTLSPGHSNQGIARLLAARRPVIQRAIDDTTLVEAATLMSQLTTEELDEISGALDDVYGAISEYLASLGDEASDIRWLEEIGRRADALDTVAIRMKEDRADTTAVSGLGQVKAFAQRVGPEARRLRRAFGAPPDTKGDRYRKETEPGTKSSLTGGTMKHLLITPRPGTDEAEGGGQQYPTGVTPDQEMVLALPPTSKDPSPFQGITKVGAGPPVLEVLAVGGGHGGVKALFDQVGWSSGAFNAAYWKNEVVTPLVAAGVQTKLVVLDACLTASMFDIFAPLLAPGGRIIGSMYSINGRLMTPEVWAEIFEAEKTGGDVTEIVERRGRELASAAPQAAAATMADSLRSMESPDVVSILKREPSLGPFISKLRHLPKISDKLAAYVRAKSDARRLECVEDLKKIAADTPPPEKEEMTIVTTVIQLIETTPAPEEIELAQLIVRTRLQEVTKSTLEEASALERLVRGQVASDLATTPAAAVPAQTAVFDLATKTIRFDAAFQDPMARKNVELSTGSQSAREMSQIDAALKQMATSGLATLTPVAKGDIFNH